MVYWMIFTLRVLQPHLIFNQIALDSDWNLTSNVELYARQLFKDKYYLGTQSSTLQI